MTTTVLINPSAIATTTDLDNTKSAFYLPRQDFSIFVGNLKCREYPDMPLIYGFLHKQMGIKLRKHIAKTYADEQTHYKHYIKKYNYDEEYIETKYYLPKHKWGRINPFGSLSLSLFHRPTRHSFAKKNYLDFDMINAQVQLLFELAKKEKMELTGGLEEYCANPKKCRYDIAEYYKLKNIMTDDGYCLTAYEQAKKLPLRLAFGGGIYTWKKEYVSIRIADMPLIDNLMTDLVLLRNLIVKKNPHIKADLAEGEDWNNKTDTEKDRSVMAFFAQTWERIIQEFCIADLVKTYGLSLGDIIPSQDGFMPLEKVIKDKNINIADLFDRFNRRVLKKFGVDIKWSEKGFDEAIDIKPSDIVPINLTVYDLELGEARVAETIYPALKNKLIYSSKTNLWYYTDKRNIWCKTKYADEYLVAKTIQYYINPIIDGLWKQYRECGDNAEKKKEIKKEIDEANKYYNSVGKSSYVGQTVKYLRTLLTDNNFMDKLDNTGGKIIFADGIFDLKTAEFRRGIYKDDYVSFTLSINYPVDYDNKKMETLKTILKKILNWNDEHLLYYLGVLGYAFSGDAHLEKSIYYIVDGTEGGRGDNGKTFFLDVLTHLYPEYVKQADPKLLEASNTKSHKQLPTLDGARIAWLDEGTKNKVNATLIKKIGDGMKINTDIMYGNTIDLVVSYKMFVCSNHIPKIDKDEEAVYNRYKQIQFCSHFDRTGSVEQENFETLDFIANPKLGDELKADYSDEIMTLLLEYGMKYYEEGLPPIPQQFKDAVNKTKTENNDFAKLFYETFEAKEGHNISMNELESVLPYEGKELMKELNRIGIKYNKDLRGFDEGKKTKLNKDGKEVHIKGGITGYSLIEEEVLEEIVEK